MKKRRLIAVLFLLAAMTACKNNNNENIESVTVSITAEEPAPEITTEQTEKGLHGLGDYTEATVSEKIYEPVIIQGTEYNSGNNIWLDMELKYDDGSYWDITDTDVENLNSFDNVNLFIYNSGSRDLHFLDNCKTITSLNIYDFGGDAEEYLEALRKLPLEYLYINALNEAYSLAQAEKLQGHMPFCNVNYCTPSDFKIDMVNGPDKSVIDTMNRIGKVRCTIENSGNNSLDFLNECRTISELQLNNFTGEMSNYIDLIKQLALEKLTVNAVNFSEVDSALLMKEMPYCEITYAQGGDVSFTTSKRNDSCFFVKPTLGFGYDYSTWGDAERWQTWNEHLCMRLCNFTKEEVTAESLRIYHNNNDIWEPVKFKNGEDILPLDITLEPEHFPNNGYIDFRDYNYILSDDDMDYSLLENGRYKAVVKFNDAEYEMEFFVTGKEDALDFLTPEQAEVLRKGNRIIGEYFACSNYLPEEFDKETKTFEDFYNEYLSALTYEYAYELAVDNYFIHPDGSWWENIGGDRGSDITYEGGVFLPVFSDDSTVILKSVNIYAHGDIPFEIWYDEYNFRMVKTEDGWKLDSARIGY